jgi:hemoglobin
MSIFKQIGGKPAVDAAVDRFYELMLADDRVKHFFTDVSIDKLKAHQKDFMNFALGGTESYDGKSMREAHQRLVTNMGLSDEHFDATVENLVTALRDLNVPEELIAEAGKVVESTREDVLCRS